MHTPGPWTILARNRLLRDRKVPGFDVTQANGEMWDRECICDKATEHDARLIAAAPELLEACKHLERYVRTGEAGRYGFAVTFPPDDESLAVLRAAIAKAEATVDP